MRTVVRDAKHSELTESISPHGLLDGLTLARKTEFLPIMLNGFHPDLSVLVLFVD